MSEKFNYIFYGIPAESSWLTTWAPIVTAIASLLVAAWALRFSAKQIKIMETNNKIMTKPNLDIWLSRTHGNSESNKIELTNSGIGPAIIRSVKVLVDGAPILSEEPMIEALTLLFNIPAINHLTTASITEGEYLSPSQTIKLVGLSNIPMNPNEIREVLRERLQIIVEYRSVYDESFIIDFQRTHGASQPR